MTGYDELAALAERELELVSAGSLDELPGICMRRKALIAALPPAPPNAARPALERAAACQARTTAVLEERLQTTGAELGKLTRGRTAMHGYGAQNERVSLVDRAG